MSYKSTGYGERGMLTELGQPPIPGGFPGFPGGLPGPIAPHPGAPGPTTPASIFPTNTRVGDVVNVTGPFGGLHQGQVRVKFQGTGWLSPQIMGPTMASVVVPEGAQNGLCEVEIDGRRVFGANCIVERGGDRVGAPSHAGRDMRAWNWAGGELVRVGATDSSALAFLKHPVYVWASRGSAVLCTYHGYKRNRGSIKWALLWSIFGGVMPFFATPLAIAQGIGKPKSKGA